MNVGSLIDKVMIGLLAIGMMISTGILPLTQTTVKVASETYSVSESKEKPYLASQLINAGILSQNEADNVINTMIENQGLKPIPQFYDQLDNLVSTGTITKN